VLVSRVALISLTNLQSWGPRKCCQLGTPALSDINPDCLWHLRFHWHALNTAYIYGPGVISQLGTPALSDMPSTLCTSGELWSTNMSDQLRITPALLDRKPGFSPILHSLYISYLSRHWILFFANDHSPLIIIANLFCTFKTSRVHRIWNVWIDLLKTLLFMSNMKFC
jgi:hypothetical protein